MKVIDMCLRQQESPMFICDVSPPRGPDRGILENIRNIGADLICVAYNPGMSVRVNSAMLAAAIREHCGIEVIFNIATRDMNKLAVQSTVLGAEFLGLENLVVVGGDPFKPSNLHLTSEPRNFTSTELIRSLLLMNRGVDYKGKKLEVSSDVCVGASIDPENGMIEEAKLTCLKVNSGAQFFITQPIFDVEKITRFCDIYATISGNDLETPIFWGVQVLVKDGINFSKVPEQLRMDLANGRDGVEIALGVIEQLKTVGINRFYLIPPVIRGGYRDYESAKRLLGLSKR